MIEERARFGYTSIILYIEEVFDIKKISSKLYILLRIILFQRTLRENRKSLRLMFEVFPYNAQTPKQILSHIQVTLDLN